MEDANRAAYGESPLAQVGMVEKEPRRGDGIEDQKNMVVDRHVDSLFPSFGEATTNAYHKAQGFKASSFDPLSEAEAQSARATSPLVYMAIREGAKGLAKLILTKVKPGSMRDNAISALQMVVAFCDAALAS